MDTKDWILLLVPILCNGIVVVVLQKIFEKRRLVLNNKYAYVSVLQGKIDNALVLFAEAAQADGETQISWLEQFVDSYCDANCYYQQHQVLLKSLKKYMDELIKIHKQMQSIQDDASNAKSSLEARKQMDSSFHRIFDLLQSIQYACINYKV